MITVLEDGTKKTFYTKCRHCASELEYDYDEVIEGNLDDYQTPIKWRYIVCPVCLSKMEATLLTKEEQTHAPFFSPWYPAATTMKEA